jgi:hypothetical protein
VGPSSSSNSSHAARLAVLCEPLRRLEGLRVGAWIGGSAGDVVRKEAPRSS